MSVYFLWVSPRNNDLNDWRNKENPKDNNITNNEKYELDDKLVDKKYIESKKEIRKTQYISQIKKQTPEIVKTGFKEGVTMGSRMALGIVFKEITESVFFELRDLIVNGENKDISFIAAFKIRISRVINKVKSKWREALKAFGEGMISGFFSNLITFIVNTFFTTFKRLVRVIREGFKSIVSAIKIMAFPKEGMKGSDAIFEAMKILSAATVTCIGLLLEEALSTFMKSVPFLAPFAEILSPVTNGDCNRYRYRFSTLWF